MSQSVNQKIAYWENWPPKFKIMKANIIAVLMITISSLIFFCGCNKSANKSSTPTEGSVIFWTQNAAKLSACSNNITITLKETSSGVSVGTCTITILNGPHSTCVGSSSITLQPGNYIATVAACAFGGGMSFAIIAGDCTNIEIL